MPDHSHLRVERPVRRRRAADPRQPRHAQRDVRRDDLVVGRGGGRAGRRPVELRAVVVTGEGSAFCSGGNTSWIASEPDATVDQLRTRMLPFYRAWLSIRTLEVPTIAAVNGPAIGAGLCLALACDLRYAAAGARLGVPFVKLGMHAGHGRHLPAAGGGGRGARPRPAAHRPGRGRRRGAPDRPGLAGARPGDVPATTCWRSPPASPPRRPIATRLTKLALRDGGHADLESALQWEAMAQPITLATEDLQEGIRASQEKRPPEFRGR